MARYSPAPGIVCRLATHDDYDDVMAINRDLYGGLDYLAHRYHRYLDEPKRQLIVVEKDNKIVIKSFPIFLLER